MPAQNWSMEQPPSSTMVPAAVPGHRSVWLCSPSASTSANGDSARHMSRSSSAWADTYFSGCIGANGHPRLIQGTFETEAHLDLVQAARTTPHLGPQPFGQGPVGRRIVRFVDGIRADETAQALGRPTAESGPAYEASAIRSLPKEGLSSTSWNSVRLGSWWRLSAGLDYERTERDPDVHAAARSGKG